MTNLNKAEERKKKKEYFLNKAFSLYPEWKGSVNLPDPIYPEKLKNVDLSNKQIKQLGFDEKTLSILCGTIFSDSNLGIHKGYANARLQARHSTRQYTWFFWKYLVILKDFVVETGISFQDSDGYQVESELLSSEIYLGKLHVMSKANQQLTALHTILCENGKKTIKRSWLNHMNSYFLMTIWLDDGGLYHKYQGIISFNFTPEDQQLIFRDYLDSVWGIKTVFQDTGKIMSNGKRNIRIAIANQDSLLRLLRLVAPLIPVREMLYKVCFVPKNNLSLLQRWKTELIDLVRPEFKVDIEKYYDNLPSDDDVVQSNPSEDFFDL